MAITLDGTTGITTPTYGGTVTAEYSVPVTSFKNRIINGAMVIDQRNAGAEVNPAVSGTYYLDRWAASLSVVSKFKIGQNAGSVTPAVGFSNYLGVTSLSAYSVAAGDYFGVYQSIEGLNIADLAWGTANAATVTLSFKVYSSLTGTFGGALRNSAANRSYPFTYTISSSNTWTTVSITITGDTTGTWLTTNGVGFQLVFGLGVGTTYSGTAGAWAGANYLSATGATSVVGTNGATFYITGVQLEKGSTATSFDYRPYGTELMLCQRYYEKTLGQGTTSSSGQSAGALFGVAVATTVIAAQWTYKQTKRTTPTITLYSFNGTAGAWANLSNTDFTVTQPWGASDNGIARFDSTGMTVGAGYWGFATAAAEL